MMRFLRRHRGWLMIVITILALPFIFYFVKTDYAAIQPDDFIRMYNRTVPMVEANRSARLHDLAQGLGMFRFTQALSSGAQDQNQIYTLFAINLIILRHEAARLGIRPTAQEAAEFVRNLQPFRGPAGFDPQKYEEFTTNRLGPSGMGDDQLEQLARDELSLNRIKELVATGVAVPESEVKNNFEQAYGKVFASVVRIKASDFAKEVKVTDDDIQKYFESHKNAYKTDEKRKVELVALTLTEEQQKTKGKERIEPLQKLADKANEFVQALSEKGADFRQVAAKFQLPVETTGEFTQVAPDPKLKDGQLAATAFHLTTEEPNSDVVQGSNGFYLLHLAGATPARPLTLEEAKPKIVEAIQNSRTRELAANKGAQIAHDLREGLKAGEPVAAVCQKTGVKSEKVEPFSLMDDVDQKEPGKEAGKEPGKTAKRDKPPDFIPISNAVSALQPGDVSDFTQWQDGGLVVVLEKREPPDEAKYREKQSDFEQRILSNKREIVFRDWLQERQREAGVLSRKG